MNAGYRFGKSCSVSLNSSSSTVEYRVEALAAATTIGSSLASRGRKALAQTIVIEYDTLLTIVRRAASRRVRELEEGRKTKRTPERAPR